MRVVEGLNMAEHEHNKLQGSSQNRLKTKTNIKDYIVDKNVTKTNYFCVEEVPKKN